MTKRTILILISLLGAQLGINAAASSSSATSPKIQKQVLAATETPQKWLILGADERSHPWWQKYFDSKNITWDALNNQEDCSYDNCIKANFNNLDDLRGKLADNSYDVILFDWATANFAKWDKPHLEILKSKLKKGGLLYIDFLIKSYTRTKNKFPTDMKYIWRMLEINKDKTGLRMGDNLALERSESSTDTQFQAHKAAFLKYIHDANLKLLREVFGPEHVIMKTDKFYPLVNVPEEKTYYLATKPMRWGKFNVPNIEIKDGAPVAHDEE